MGYDGAFVQKRLESRQDASQAWATWLEIGNAVAPITSAARRAPHGL
jgi:hypothetical protein